MAVRRARIKQTDVVQRFAARLRSVRISRGMTQAELARKAVIGVSYVSRLEGGSISPGLDLIDRLAQSLGTTISDLIPETAVPDSSALLREQAQTLLGKVLESADTPTLSMLCPLLARLAESPTRH